MNFWTLSHPAHQKALIDEHSKITLSYKDLLGKVITFEKQLNRFKQKTLGFIFCHNYIDSIAAYLASLRTSHAVFLLDANLHETLISHLIDTYQPEWIVLPKSTVLPMVDDNAIEVLSDSWFYTSKTISDSPIHPELALLLSTSGSTGSPKVVRLSYRNLSENAKSIASYLGLSESERPITTLPMHYSYGLSVINSHLLVGATLLLTNDSVSTQDFWTFAKANQATSMAGVPYTYQTLHRLGLEKMHLPMLKTLTQAGGRLSPALVQHFAKLAEHKPWQFYVMYGQTEATARISYVPPEQLIQKPDTIGLAIPQGKLSLDPDTSELIYEGPNVMMGYAVSRDDLSKGDELSGLLRTGDLAKQDNDGFFTITGRSHRFLKLFGLRINLEDVESVLTTTYQLAAAASGNDDKLHIYIEEHDAAHHIKQELAKLYQIHPTAIHIHALEKIPRTARGKVNYEQLKMMEV